MGIDVKELRELIIRPCLQMINEDSETAENLLLGTAAQESVMGEHYFCEHTNGLGIYRITAEKHVEIWDTYLVQFPELASLQRGIASQHQFLKNPHTELITNLSYATGIAWMIYRRAEIDTNKSLEFSALAALWANHFDNGTGTARNPDDFIKTYRTLVLDDSKKLVA